MEFEVWQASDIPLADAGSDDSGWSFEIWQGGEMPPIGSGALPADENLRAANIGAYILLSSNLPDGDPTSLTATAISSSQINLTWLDNATNEAGYYIERSYPTASAFSTIASLAANSTSYSDTGLTPDRTYYYRVRAYTIDGYSAYSNTASDHTFAIVAPESGAGDPLIGAPDDKFIVELTNPADDWQLNWLDNLNVRVLWYGATAQGGYDRAELAVGTTDANLLWDVARKLGWYITIRNRDLSPVWVGMIESVEIDTGNAQVGLSLENMFNRIAVAYSYDDGNGVTTRATTAWSEDTESTGRYGTKELLYSLGDASADQAEAQRDTLLADLSAPAPIMRIMRSGQLGATVRCIGLWHTLDWVYYSNSEGLEENNISSGSAQPLGQGYTASTIGLTSDGRIHDKTAGRIAALTSGHNIEISGTSGGTNDGTALLDSAPRDSEAYTNTTISFVATSDIDDSEEALRPFSRDDIITVSGSSSNNGDYVVEGGGSAGINVTSTGITNESAGSSVTITSAESIRTDQTFTEELPSSSITLAVHGIKIDQAFTPTVNASWTVNKIFIRARKVGSPADNLKVELCADSAGAPGTVLDSQTVAGSSLGTVMAWITFDMSNADTISYGTTYHLVVSRSGSNDIDDYYVIDVDEDLSYASGAMKLWDGAAWVARATDADLIFRITGATETTAQVSDIFDACGQFFTALDVVDASGVYANQYRAGDGTGVDEMAALLNPGTGSTRLLATVTPERILRITAQPASSDDNLLLSSDGTVALVNNRPLPHGRLPSGEWVRLADVPGNVDALAALRNIFIERAEFHASDDNLRLEALGDVSPWDIGKVTDRELSRQAERLKPYIKSWD